MAKSINLGPGLQFPSITVGRAHYGPILDGTPVGQHIPPQHFNDVKILYETYCAKANWPMPSAPVAFGTQLEQFNTKCFNVEFADGTKTSFSLDKALSKVAQ